MLFARSAYVVHRAGYASFKSQAERDAFGKEVQTWIQSRVAKHKYLRGGELPVMSSLFSFHSFVWPIKTNNYDFPLCSQVSLSQTPSPRVRLVKSCVDNYESWRRKSWLRKAPRPNCRMALDRNLYGEVLYKSLISYTSNEMKATGESRSGNLSSRPDYYQVRGADRSSRCAFVSKSCNSVT
jgi:hypothetical protein